MAEWFRVVRRARQGQEEALEQNDSLKQVYQHRPPKTLLRRLEVTSERMQDDDCWIVELLDGRCEVRDGRHPAVGWQNPGEAPGLAGWQRMVGWCARSYSKIYHNLHLAYKAHSSLSS